MSDKVPSSYIVLFSSVYGPVPRPTLPRTYDRETVFSFFFKVSS